MIWSVCIETEIYSSSILWLHCSPFIEAFLFGLKVWLIHLWYFVVYKTSSSWIKSRNSLSENSEKCTDQSSHVTLYNVSLSSSMNIALKCLWWTLCFVFLFHLECYSYVCDIFLLCCLIFYFFYLLYWAW